MPELQGTWMNLIFVNCFVLPVFHTSFGDEMNIYKGDSDKFQFFEPANEALPLIRVANYVVALFLFSWWEIWRNLNHNYQSKAIHPTQTLKSAFSGQIRKEKEGERVTRDGDGRSRGQKSK